MDSIGEKLRTARHAWNLSLKEVEVRTLRLSVACGNPAYRISASWLHRVEQENRGLSATKLIVLASLYNFTAQEMLALCPMGEIAFDVPKVSDSPNVTVLSGTNLDEHAKRWLPISLLSEIAPIQSAFIPSEHGMPNHFRRGIVGLKDRTLDPMVPPGSILMIDTQKRSVLRRSEWNHEFDRPIYFLLTREGYIAGFCEIDRDPAWINVVPHALSLEASRRYLRQDIELIGTVVAVAIKR